MTVKPALHEHSLWPRAALHRSGGKAGVGGSTPAGEGLEKLPPGTLKNERGRVTPQFSSPGETRERPA